MVYLILILNFLSCGGLLILGVFPTESKPLHQVDGSPQQLCNQGQDSADFPASIHQAGVLVMVFGSLCVQVLDLSFLKGPFPSTWKTAGIRFLYPIVCFAVFLFFMPSMFIHALNGAASVISEAVLVFLLALYPLIYWNLPDDPLLRPCTSISTDSHALERQ